MVDEAVNNGWKNMNVTKGPWNVKKTHRQLDNFPSRSVP